LKFNLITMAVVIVALVLLAGHGSQLVWTVPRIAGAAIAIPAFVLFVTARLQLGSAFSVKAKASILVTTGLYSRVRNPIYVFGSLLIFGVMIWANKPWWLLCFLVLIPMQLYRSRKEEQVLTEKFGDAYLDYKRKTWF
jgi:protein-S-isoprenylcysteine O-methyltransferase Ste14